MVSMAFGQLGAHVWGSANVELAAGAAERSGQRRPKPAKVLSASDGSGAMKSETASTPVASYSVVTTHRPNPRTCSWTWSNTSDSMRMDPAGAILLIPTALSTDTPSDTCRDSDAARTVAIERAPFASPTFSLVPPESR